MPSITAWEQYESMVEYGHDFRGIGGARAPQIIFQGTGEGQGHPIMAEVIKLATHVECELSAHRCTHNPHHV
jgi:hypothetical protein